MTNPIADNPPPITIGDLYSSMPSIQNIVDGNVGTGNAAAASLADSKIRALNAYYTKEEILQQQINKNVTQMAATQNAAISDSTNNGNSGNIVDASTTPEASEPSGIFGLFNE